MFRSRMPTEQLRSSAPRRRARGAALVEYVLLLAVFLVAVVYSLGLVNDEVERDTSQTAAEIGGVTASTVPIAPDTSVPGPTTTMPVNSRPVVYAGPDIVIPPSSATWTTQNGTVADADTPASLLDVTWSSSSASLAIRNPVTGGANTSVEVRGTRPGTYTLTLAASDGDLTGTDTALVKITSGIVRVSSFSTTGWWTDTRRLTWNARASIRVTNPFGFGVGGLTVRGTWTFSNGTTQNMSCITTASGDCTITRTGISNSISSACFAITGLTGPAGCFDGWDGVTRNGCVNRDSLPAPTTTTTSTTTTTRPSSTTTTTRPSSTTTTTTRPPTTTTTTTIAL